MMTNNVDTKLLGIFMELLSKQNATYVAEKLHITGPAVSHSLNRLREIFGDPLFIRVPHGLTLMLWASINDGDTGSFEPNEASGTLSFGFSPLLGDAIFNTFVLRLKQLAPNLQIRLAESVCWDADMTAMRANELDLVFSPFPTRQQEIVEEPVTSFNMWVCARADHPELRTGCTLEQYMHYEHIFLAHGNNVGSGRQSANMSLIPLDYALQQRGLKRNATMTVHSWRAQAEIAAQTDMIFTVNSLTKDLVCQSYGLNAFPLPPELETVLGLNMYWHRSRSGNPLVLWARNVFREVVGEYLGVQLAIRQVASDSGASEVTVDAEAESMLPQESK
jgi:LysR family transcriptional regulator of virulence genes